MSVIKRNEEVEGAERQRVGRLVDKLERIKERIVDCGPNQCNLCGHIFRFLTSPKVICEDCQKAVCSKCSIDLIVKRPLPGTNGAASAAGPAAVGGGGGAGAASPTTTTLVHVLCKVCSLTREIWKKSGAWFFKAIPKYDLPPPVQPQYRRTLTTIRLQGNLSSDDSDDDDDDVFRMFKNRRKRVLDTTSLVSHDSQSTIGSSLLETQSLKSQANVGGGGGGAGVGMDTESIYSVSSCVMVRRNSSNDSIREASVGWLEVVLSYNEAEQMLQASVIRARDLRSMDANGFTDPFCKLNIVTAEGVCRHVNWSRTKTVHKTRNPEFNESISFAGVTEENLCNGWLYIVLLDDDKYGHDFLGTAKVNLAMVCEIGGRQQASERVGRTVDC